MDADDADWMDDDKLAALHVSSPLAELLAELRPQRPVAESAA